MINQNEIDIATTLTMEYIDRQIYDKIYDEEIREDYAGLIIEDLIEEIDDLESEDIKEITKVGTLSDVQLNG